MLVFGHKNAPLSEAVRLDELLDQAVELVLCDYDLKKRCELKSEQIVREYDPRLPAVVINRSEMEQALINLIKNAVHALFPPREGVTPQVVVRARQNGAWASVQIEDNGCGMPPEVQRRLFEPFFTTKEVGVGTGLGMSVAYAVVVKNHRGRIQVESAEGKGTKMTVHLPLLEAKR
jgi:signal transduction histidine kinase